MREIDVEMILMEAVLVRPQHRRELAASPFVYGAQE
jgi:hypothetical protein